MGEDPISLPEGDTASSVPLISSLGLLERMAEDFAKAMDDDFNSREGVAKVLGMIRVIQRCLDSLVSDDRASFASWCIGLLEETAGDVLGVLPSREVALTVPDEDPRRAGITDEVEALLIDRAEARAVKDWTAADAIRDRLNEMGVEVTDTAEGPVWSII